MIKKPYMLLKMNFSDFKNHYPIIVSMLQRIQPFALANAAELKNTVSLDSAVLK